MNSRNIVTQNKELSGLREEQRVHDKALEGARAEQAKVRTSVMQKEKTIKKAEKTLDAKVRVLPRSLCQNIDLSCRGLILYHRKHKSLIRPGKSTMG